MSETQMPAAEANTAVMLDEEQNSYELAFHVLPTVAEGEVSGVFEAIKTLITKRDGEIFDEEAPERFELAYEIVKHLEGRNRKFASAYFGWVRFKANAEAVEPILEEMGNRADILRHLLIRLTKVEEENPFRFHPGLESTKKMVTTIDEDLLTADALPVESETQETAEDTADTDAEGESKDGEVK